MTDAIADKVKVWQNRPLDPSIPSFKWTPCGSMFDLSSKVVYLALGVTMDGIKEDGCRERGAKFWLQVVIELKNRGVLDIFIACVDRLKGFPEAIEAVFPRTQIQLCLVHMVRHSLKCVSWKQRKELAEDLKTLYQAATAEHAEIALWQTLIRDWKVHFF